MGMYRGSLDELCCLRGRPHMTHTQATGHRCFWRQQIWAGLWRERQEWGGGVQIGLRYIAKRGRSWEENAEGQVLATPLFCPVHALVINTLLPFSPKRSVPGVPSTNLSISHISEFTLSSPRVNKKSVLAQPALSVVPPDQVQHGRTSRVSYWVKSVRQRQIWYHLHVEF